MNDATFMKAVSYFRSLTRNSDRSHVNVADRIFLQLLLA